MDKDPTVSSSLDNIKSNSVFKIFLITHLVVWTAICLIRLVMPTDTLEGIYWGSLHDFGTHKHPPLAGWLTYLAWIPFKIDFLVYLMSQLFIVAGFIYTYKLARFFLEENKAVLSVMLLEGCWAYSYITSYYGFNPDVVLFLTLPAISYYFYKCMTMGKNSDWIKLGLIVGISFLNKYQTILLIIPMAIWAIIFKREIFKQAKIYIAAVLAFLIFLPHFLWLIKYDFFPLGYFESELSANSWVNHITAPFMFLMMQFAIIAGSALIYVLTKIKFKSPFKLIQNYDKKVFWFLILLVFVPLIIHLTIGFCLGGAMRPRWGYEFWSMIGIVFFYFFPCKIGKKEFNFTVKSVYVVMFIIFTVLATLFSVEKNFRSRYPVKTVFEDFKNIWAQEYNTPLKYVGGYIEYTMPFTIYGDTHPANILDTNGYKNPWIDENDLKKSGAIVIDRHPEQAELYARKTIPYLPKDYKIKPIEYKFFVHNAFGQPREYSIFYIIIPPIKNNTTIGN